MNRTAYASQRTRPALFRALRTCNTRGTAAIETAIVLPLYMLVLFGVIYFGYATLSRQRQTVASSFSAWLPGDQQADDLLEEFWPWEGNAYSQGIEDHFSVARAGDTVLGIGENSRLGDPYYGNEIATQLDAGAGELGGGGEDTFDLERVTVALWNLALGERSQHFDWVEGEGFVEVFEDHWDHYASYLNVVARSGTGFIVADEGSPPVVGNYENWIVASLNGMGNGHWLERRAATTDATYRPPFFNKVYREEGAEKTDFSTLVSGDYDEPEYSPTVDMVFDVTGRGDGWRSTVSDGETPHGLISQVANLFEASTLPEPTDFDSRQIGVQRTLSDLWVSQ